MGEGTRRGQLIGYHTLGSSTGLASHLVMDVCLHWGDADLSWDEFVEVARVDGTLGLAVCAAALVAAPRWARPGVAAAIAGCRRKAAPARCRFGSAPQACRRLC